MCTTANKAAPVQTLSPLHSQARDWPALRAFVQDALADAMHHHAAMVGARPELTLMLSRRFLPTHLLPAQEVQHQLQAMSRELRRQGVFHAVHMVVIGNVEPASHELRITLSQI
jgi:hypothetical protein